MRGAFNLINDIPSFHNSDKTLLISMVQSQMVWSPLLVQGLNGLSLRRPISKILNELKEAIADYSDRQFIYFIATRPKVRIASKARRIFFSPDIKIPLKIGGLKKEVIRVNWPGVEDRTIKYDIDNDDISLTFKYGKQKITSSIHDILLQCNVNIGLNSTVQYVGKTDNPGRRVVDGNHRGLSDIVSLAADENNDVFLFQQVFHLRLSSSSPGIDFITSTSITDYLSKVEEADLIENLFIHYFAPYAQPSDVRNSKTRLTRILSYLKIEKNISRVLIEYEELEGSEYYKFGSRAVPHSFRHYISYQVDDEDNLVVATNPS